MEGNFFNQAPFKEKLTRVSKSTGLDFGVVACACSLTAKYLSEDGKDGYKAALTEVLEVAGDDNLSKGGNGDVDRTIPVARELILSFKGDVQKAVELCARVAGSLRNVGGWEHYVYESGPVVNDCLKPTGAPKPYCRDALTMAEYEDWRERQGRIADAKMSAFAAGVFGGERRSGRSSHKHIQDEWSAR